MRVVLVSSRKIILLQCTVQDLWNIAWISTSYARSSKRVSISIISKVTMATRKSTCYSGVLSKVKTYGDEQLTAKGVIKVEVQYKNQHDQLQLVMTQGNGLNSLESTN